MEDTTNMQLEGVTSLAIKVIPSFVALYYGSKATRYVLHYIIVYRE